MNRPEALILTPEEEALGFQLLMLESDGVEPMELTVAYIVNASEIVAKTFQFERDGYKHRCWGIMHYKQWPGTAQPPVQTRPRWHPLGLTIYDDPGEAIQGSEFDPDAATLAPIQRLPFHSEPYNPAKHGL